jgi:hypothetical protein
MPVSRSFYRINETVYGRESNGSLDALEEFGRNLSRLRPDLENIVEFGGTKACKDEALPLLFVTGSC